MRFMVEGRVVEVDDDTLWAEAIRRIAELTVRVEALEYALAPPEPVVIPLEERRRQMRAKHKATADQAEYNRKRWGTPSSDGSVH